MTVIDDWATVNHHATRFDPPTVLRLDVGAVGRLNFQPRWCVAPLECVASRRGDVVELVFACHSVVLGDNSGYRVTRCTPSARWRYRLARIEGAVVIAERINR